MEDRGGRDAAVRHLCEAIERVRRDVAVVEFWADAVAGFAQPVPEYGPGDMSVWLPPEQATALRGPAKSGPSRLSRDRSKPS
jgi:hypothetical protein